MGYFGRLKSTVVRNLQVDLKYKFNLVIDVAWLILDIIAFTFLGAIVATTSIKNFEYNLADFLLVGVFFWALFGRAYDDTVLALQEEAARGTIGFLLVNNISIRTLLIARFFSSTVKTITIAMIFIFPILWAIGVIQVDLTLIPLIITLFFLSWIFMIGVSLLVSSLNVIFKRIGVLASLFLYALKIASGYYFPVEALDLFFPGLAQSVLQFPLTRCVYLLRELLILGRIHPNIANDILMISLGAVICIGLALIVMSQIEKLSAKWGTLEFY